MRTKLVYVLTCAPEKTYIEQALMSVYSARHWNPEAHIVLITDNLTDALLTGKRGEILQYISEKIVVPFPDTDNMMYRSRWLKTSVRSLIEGDFMFIDCDTLCQKPLGEIDSFECSVGAVYESHLPVSQFCNSLLQKAKELTSTIGVDIEAEEYYYSSGVLFVRDTPQTHRLYELWHQYWLEGNALGLHIDQPSLAKANRDMGKVIEKIPDTYNCILFTRNDFTRDSHILHITAYMNPCFLFNENTLQYVKSHGLQDNKWLTDSVKNPCCSFLPFNYDVLHSTCRQRSDWKKQNASFLIGYGRDIEPSFASFQMQSRLRGVIICMLRHRLYLIAMSFWMIWTRMNVFRKRNVITPNNCCK